MVFFVEFSAGFISLFVCSFWFFNVFLVCPSLFVFLPIFYLLFFVYFFFGVGAITRILREVHCLLYAQLFCFIVWVCFGTSNILTLNNLLWALLLKKNIFSSTKIMHLVVFNCFVFYWTSAYKKKLFWSIKGVRVWEWASSRTRKCEGLKVCETESLIPQYLPSQCSSVEQGSVRFNW